MPQRWCALIVALGFALGSTAAWPAEDETPTAPAGPASAQPANPTIKGDELTVEGDRALYTGVTQQVRFAYRDSSITADRLIWDAKTRIVEAEGNVVLSRGTELFVTCSRLRYDIESGRGVAAFTMSAADPWYAWGRKIYRVSAEEYRVANGYVTTDDYLRPNWRIRAKTIVIVPGVKVVAYNAVVYIGRVPILFWPKYVQRLDDKRSPFSVSAGRTADWGAYILTAYNFMVQKAKASVHLDYRQKQEWATGFDLTVPMPNGGEGDLLTYYADDRSGQTDQQDRWRLSYKQRQPLGGEWDAWLELHKLSDADMLEDFFRDDFENERQPRNFLHVQRTGTHFLINGDLEVQLNDFYEVIERKPDLSIEFPQQRLGNSPFYYEGITSTAWLERRFPKDATQILNPDAPPEEQQVVPIEDYSSARVDSFHEFSYPRKYFGWLNIVPHLSLRGTYYSHGVAEDDLFRGLVSTEIEFFTKLFKLWDVEDEANNINGLRHVVEPRITYYYTPEPTKTPDEILQFDSVDELDKEDRFRFGVRNKLQTKRYGGAVWDLVDLDTYIDFYPEENAVGDSWGDVHHDLELRPSRTFWIDADAAWNVGDAALHEFNTQATIFDEDRWLQSLEYRYRTSDEAHLVAVQSYEKLTELWWLEGYLRYNLQTGDAEESEIAFSHDLRTWVMTLAYRRLAHDDQIWVMFNLKAYPEMGIRSSH
jgi:LPS-assembly protein